MNRLPIYLLLVFLLVGTPTAGATDRNFLANEGFEQGQGPAAAGWNPVWWILQKPPPALPPVEGSFSRSQEQAHLGTWSLKLDTTPVLGKEVALSFNGEVDAVAARASGGTLVLTGWVYVKPGTAVRPVSLRLRTFGVLPDGTHDFTGDVLSTSALGEPGRWTRFRAVGKVPKAVITGMDLHCDVHADMVPTVQYLDDIRVEALVPPLLDVRPLGSAFWRDRSALPVEVRLNGLNIQRDAVLYIRLLSSKGEVAAGWQRPGFPTVLSLPLPHKLLPEGVYRLHVDLLEGMQRSAAGEATIELAASPWEGAPLGLLDVGSTMTAVRSDPVFTAMGTTAPTNLPDATETAPPKEAGVPAQADSPGMPYRVFSPPAFDSISRLRQPLPGEEDPVRSFGCPGQYVPVALAVQATRALNAVKVQFGQLRNTAGRSAAISTDVRVVRTIQQLPPFLEKRAAVDIPAGQTQTFWLTTHIGPGVAPGFYEGEIRVVAASGQPAILPYLLRVLPLKLAPPEKGYGFWWGMDARWNGYYSKTLAEAREQVRKQFILLHEHGCNMISLDSLPKLTKLPDGNLSFNFNEDLFGYQCPLGETYRLGRETGFFSPRIPLQYVGADSLATYGDAYAKVDRSSPAFDNFYRETCRQIDRWAKEQGFPLAFACVDEIGNSAESRVTALRFYDLASQAGVLTSVTDNSTGGGNFLTAQPRFSRITKLRLFDFVWPDVIRQTRETGGIPWNYNLGSSGWNPAEDRLAFGLFTDRVDAGGHAQWAFSYPEGNNSPYDQAAAGKSTGYHYALPSPDGPLPTVALEAVREGIDDARYRALAGRLAPSSPAISLDMILPYSFRMDEFLETHSPQWFDIERWRFARAAMKGEG